MSRATMLFLRVAHESTPTSGTRMTNANAADFELARELRRANVFQDLVPELMPVQNGTIVIPCADGERITSVLTNHWRICNGRHCHHMLSLNGGPLLIPKKSPVAKAKEGHILLEHAYGGHKLKAVNTVVLYGHWPCGAALGANLSLYDALTWCIKAKDDVRAFFEGKSLSPDVLLCFHVDWTNGKQRSYYFDRKRWEEWTVTNP